MSVAATVSPVMSVGGNWIPYTVQRYDTPWGIAETHLGNGLRWREIKTADGGTLATDMYRWVERDGRPDYEQQALTIYAGQKLWLPPDASDPRTLQLQPTPRRQLPPSILRHHPLGRLRRLQRPAVGPLRGRSGGHARPARSGTGCASRSARPGKGWAAGGSAGRHLGPS